MIILKNDNLAVKRISEKAKEIPLMSDAEKSEFRNEVLVVVFNRLTDNQKDNIHSENLIKTIEYAIKSYSADKGAFDFYLNYIFKRRTNELMRSNNGNNMANEFFEEDDRHRKTIRRLRNITKELNNIGSDLDDYSDNEIDTVCESLKISKKEFTNAIKYWRFKRAVSVDFTYESDEGKGAAIAETICDERADISVALFDSVVVLYEMFSYIFHNSKEKKHPIFKMLNTNIVYKTSYSISGFKNFVDAVYDDYEKAYCAYDDKEIVLYHFFGGDRNPDKKEFANKKSTFSHTYRSEYDTIKEKWREEHYEQ